MTRFLYPCRGKIYGENIEYRFRRAEKHGGCFRRQAVGAVFIENVRYHRV